MSFDRKLIEDALYRFAREAVDMPWVFANQDGDRPPRPYGTILIRSADPIGVGDVVSDGSGLTVLERLREVFEIEVSFQTYGQSAMDSMAALKAWARRPSVVIGTRDSVLLGFLSAGGIRDLAMAFTTSWEGRAQCDFRFSARFNVDREFTTIGSVEISGAGSTQTIEEPQA